MAGIEVRRAVAADKDDILAFEDVYSGIDYLPVYFNWMTESTNNHPYVALVDGQVAAFCNCNIIEDGHSVVPMALRVAKDHQGHGLTESLKKHIRQDLQKLYPNLKTEIYTTRAVDGQLRFQRKNQDIIKVLKTWQMMLVKFSREKLLAATEQFRESSAFSPNIETLTPAEVTRRTPEILELLARDSKYFVHGSAWIAHKINPKNFREVAMFRDIMVSLSQNKGHLLSVSISNSITTESGPTPSIFYYGTSVEDCLNHIKQASLVLEKHLSGNQKAAMMIHIPQDLSFAAVESFMNEHLGEQMSDVKGCSALEFPFSTN